MAKYYRRETYDAAERIFETLIIAAGRAALDGSEVRRKKLVAMAADLEMEFELTTEERSDELK